MRNLWILLLALVINAGCYTLNGISVDPEIETFFVRNFENIAPNAPPTIAIDFTERLKDKIRSETRLRLVNQTPHVELGGKVVEYRVVPIAPRPGEESVALNRLEMTVSVYYKNSVKEKSGWAAEKRFNHFAEFSSTADLFSIQDELIRQISNQLLDDIFNAAFNDW
jgi:hypothetical protein